jgi:MOSC domain-containing protein YiiM
MRCETCSFDAAAWTESDLDGTLAAAEPWFGQLAEQARPDVLAALAPTAQRLAELPRSGADIDAVHEAWELLAAAGRLRHAMGDGAPTATGVVVQISTSPGGVPKLPVPSAAITARGVAGDKQTFRNHHGRPWQAVCLWSADVIDALAAQGHPIGYGCAGENLTLRGLDWRTIRPGVRIQVGTALLETAPYALPCKVNAQWFNDGRFRRIAHEVAPGTSRIYARVLVEGVAAAGDAAVVEPLVLPVQRSAQQLALPVDR